MARCSQIESEMQAYLDGELSRAKELIVEEHLSNCSQCKDKFEKFRKTNAIIYETLAPYKLTNSLDESIMKKLPEVETGYNEIHQITMRIKHQEETPYSFSNLFPYFAIAAMTILGIFIFVSWPAKEYSNQKKIGVALNITGTSFIINNSVNNKMKEEVPIAFSEGNYIETQDNSKVYILLKGNSIVKLSNNTRIRILDERTINLEKGLVWFDIGKDKKTFRVNTSQGFITVFGTQFQVEADFNRVITTVSRGEVTVETGNQFAVLKENQQIELKNQTINTKVKTCDSQKIMAWAEQIKPRTQAFDNASAILAPTQPIEISKPASQIFVVPIQHKEVTTLVLVWDKNKITENSNYTIYASDDELKPLFRYKLTNDMINNYNGEINIPIPNEVSIKQVNILHIEIISDDIDESISMPFNKIYAKS
ncbi:MAG TPA: FecR domain-containing protein [Candidatus Hydrogenedens sp.]|nr:FecR domain-containing protein [Candidatus Hydrogenedens sp.]